MSEGQFYNLCLAECTLADEMATFALGQRIEPCLRAGDTIGLEGEMGAGKSVLARGLIKHAMVRSNQPDTDIPSPTYTLVQHYPRIPPLSDEPKDREDMIWHVDLWRIDEPEDVLAFGLDEAMGQEICIIEWVSKLGSFLPPNGLIISLTTSLDNNERNARFLVSTGYEKHWNTVLSHAGLSITG